MLAMPMVHQPKAYIERLYLPRNEGGCVLLQLELTMKIVKFSLKTYLNNFGDWMLKPNPANEKRVTKTGK